MADKGYVGALDCVTPIKAKRGKKLDPVEEDWNKRLGEVRVIVEQVIGRIKKFEILRQIFRSPVYKHPTIFSVCAKLANLSMSVKPVRKCHAKNL